MELLICLGAGALSLFTAEKLSGRKAEYEIRVLMELILYAALDKGLLWAAVHLRDPGAETALYGGTITGEWFFISLLIALLVGMAAGGFKSLTIRFRIVEKAGGLLTGISPKLLRAVRVLLALLILALTVFLIFRPALSDLSEARYKAKEKSRAMQLKESVKEEVESLLESGTSVGDLGDILVDGISVQRVESDQQWNGGSSRQEPEAVYMTDGDGVLVYFSYRDRLYAGTWSGPSSDQAFIEANGGWAGGQGIGWSGALMQENP